MCNLLLGRLTDRLELKPGTSRAAPSTPHPAQCSGHIRTIRPKGPLFQERLDFVRLTEQRPRCKDSPPLERGSKKQVQLLASCSGLRRRTFFARIVPARV